MTKNKIDAMIKLHEYNLLTESQKKKLAKAIKDNPITREIALNGAVSTGDLKTAYLLLS